MTTINDGFTENGEATIQEITLAIICCCQISRVTDVLIFWFKKITLKGQ